MAFEGPDTALLNFLAQRRQQRADNERLNAAAQLTSMKTLAQLRRDEEKHRLDMRKAEAEAFKTEAEARDLLGARIEHAQAQYDVEAPAAVQRRQEEDIAQLPPNDKDAIAEALDPTTAFGQVIQTGTTTPSYAMGADENAPLTDAGQTTTPPLDPAFATRELGQLQGVADEVGNRLFGGIDTDIGRLARMSALYESQQTGIPFEQLFPQALEQESNRAYNQSDRLRFERRTERDRKRREKEFESDLAAELPSKKLDVATERMNEAFTDYLFTDAGQLRPDSDPLKKHKLAELERRHALVLRAAGGEGSVAAYEVQRKFVNDALMRAESASQLRDSVKAFIEEIKLGTGAGIGTVMLRMDEYVWNTIGEAWGVGTKLGNRFFTRVAEQLTDLEDSDLPQAEKDAARSKLESILAERDSLTGLQRRMAEREYIASLDKDDDLELQLQTYNDLRLLGKLVALSVTQNNSPDRFAFALYKEFDDLFDFTGVTNEEDVVRRLESAEAALTRSLARTQAALSSRARAGGLNPAELEDVDVRMNRLTEESRPPIGQVRVPPLPSISRLRGRRGLPPTDRELNEAAQNVPRVSADDYLNASPEERKNFVLGTLGLGSEGAP